MRKGFRVILGVIFAVTCALMVSAQTPTGSINGTVTDPNGAAVVGATVKITEKATNRELTTTTNSEGFYEARNLPPGNYSVRVEQSGFSGTTFENITVQTGQVATTDVALKLGSVGDTVTVQGTEAQLQVDTTRQTVDGVVNAAKIQQLPLNGRNFLDLAGLQPSVRVQDGGVIDPTKSNAYRAVSVNGGSGTGTRVQIDGIDVTDETVGTTTANISTDAVNEFQLSRSSFDLSTSLTTTGAVNITTRSGGNEYHGSAFYFWRNQKIGARRFDLEEKPESSRTQQGGRFGGPILKDKLFFFINGEHSSELGQNVVQINPPFPQFSASQGLPLRARYWTAKVDWAVSDNTKIFYSHRYNDDISTGGTVISPFQNVDWTNVHVVGADITAKRLTHSLRFGYVNFNNRIESRQLGVPFLLTPQGTPFQLNINDLSIGPNSLAPQQTYQDNKQFKYDGSYVRGNHTLRFGGEINRILLGGFANFAGPLTVNGDFPATPVGAASDPLNYPLLSFSTGPNSGFFTAQPAHGLPFGGHKNWRTGWYVGDSWRVRPNFTLNLGIRHNRESNMFAKGAPAIPQLERYGAGRGQVAKFPNTAFSPQVGFAWDPSGSGKTSIRGGFYLAYEMNIFNNALFDEFARIATGIGPTVLTEASVVGPTGAPIVVPISATACPDAAHGNYECLLGLPIRSTLADLGRINNAVQTAYASFFPNYDPTKGISEFANSLGNTFGGQFPGDYRIPYSIQFNIGVQRELAKNHILSVDYVRIKGIGLPYMLVDNERRRDAAFFNEAAARTSLGTRLGVAPAAVNPAAISAFIAARTAAGQTTNIGTFSLANDTIWPGVSPDLLRARLIQGGYSLYNGLQVQLNGRYGADAMSFLHLGEQRLLRGVDYTISYALSRSEATSGSGRSEFITNTTRNNDHYNRDFGPTANDRTHLFGAGLIISTIGGFNINPSIRFGSAPPVNLLVPFTDTFAGANYLFTTDINGDGGSGTTRGDVLPGTNIGDLGSRLGSWSEVNAVIANFNSNFAGKLTPAGQRLVQSGLFTEAQLVALGATVKAIQPVPESNPWPFQGRFNADVRITRPIKFRERFTVEPYLEIFNLFNNTPKGTYTGLNHTVFGNLNFPYTTADRGDLDAQVRGLLQNPRQAQFGIRAIF
ncbi:MAG TPA: carboxypeptidase regulatory-like domain-containing protein [Pyrinomonadaceae bacterium]|nr:carboxypeptidase regulatory-like domain-containing protein [Pyrinomonadaceae bacterium]